LRGLTLRTELVVVLKSTMPLSTRHGNCPEGTHERPVVASPSV
jgi:hypothetical protein